MAKHKTGKKTGVTVTYKVMDNKSRKGLYAYVKEPLKTGHYYKVKEDIGQNDAIYKEVYLSGGIKSSKGITKDKVKQLRKGKRTIKKYPNIDASFNKGYAQATIKNGLNLTPYTIRSSYKNLLKNSDKLGNKLPIVKDKELVQILTSPDNVEKWKHRVLYKVQIYDHNNEIVSTITPETVKTLVDIKKEILGSIVLGQEYSTMYNDLNERAKKFGYRTTSTENKKVRITKVNIKMVFKKG